MSSIEKKYVLFIAGIVGILVGALGVLYLVGL